MTPDDQIARVAEILERYFPSPAERRMRLLAAADIVGEIRRGAPAEHG